MMAMDVQEEKKKKRVKLDETRVTLDNDNFR